LAVTNNTLDPILEFDLVLKLARRHLPSVKAVTAVDETGGEARAYVLDDVYIFKTQRPQKVRPRTSLLKAKFHQDMLAELAPEVSVPRVFGYGREGSIEYVLESRMAGVAFRTMAIQGEQRKAILRDLGKTIRRIHSLPLAAFEKSGLFPADDSAAVRARAEASLSQAVQAIGAQREAWTWQISPEALASDLVAQLPASAACVALHSNPGPEHVIVDPASLSFSGLIDFGDAYISHPVFDMRRWTTPEDREAFLEGYRAESKLDEDFWPYWRALLAASVMTIFALRPERRAQALEDLQSLVTSSPPAR
jgi:hygromycin-B 7''-O-kinase